MDEAKIRSIIEEVFKRNELIPKNAIANIKLEDPNHIVVVTVLTSSELIEKLAKEIKVAGMSMDVMVV